MPKVKPAIGETGATADAAHDSDSIAIIGNAETDAAVAGSTSTTLVAIPTLGLADLVSQVKARPLWARALVATTNSTNAMVAAIGDDIFK